MSDTGWVAPTLHNGYVDQSGTTAYRVIDNVCHLRGTIWQGNQQGLAAFVLPLGGRPAVKQVFGSAPNNGSRSHEPSFHVYGVAVDVDGSVIPSYLGLRTLDGIVFLTD